LVEVQPVAPVELSGQATKTGVGRRTGDERRDAGDHPGDTSALRLRKAHADLATYRQRSTIECRQCSPRHQEGGGNGRAAVSGQPDGIGVAVLEYTPVGGTEKFGERVAQDDDRRLVEEIGEC